MGVLKIILIILTIITILGLIASKEKNTGNYLAFIYELAVLLYLFFG